MKTSLEDYHLLDEDSQSEMGTRPTRTECHSCRHESRYNLVLSIGLVISLGFNVLMSVRFIQEDIMKIQKVPDRSPFAGFIYDTVMQDDHGGLYDSPNEMLTNEAWESLASDHGSIAICKRCRTNVTYSRHPMLEGWPKTLDILMGMIDREDLERAELRPERHVWWEKGIEWVKTLFSEGDGGMPKHPLARLTDVVH